MSMHFRTFPALWGLVIAYVARSFAASGPFHQQFFTGANWTSYTQPDSGGLEGTYDASADVVSPLPRNLTIALEASQEPATANMSESSNSALGGSPKLKKTRGAGTSSLSFKKLGYSLTLLLFVSLLAGCIKVRICLKKIGARIPGEPEEAERVASPIPEPGGDVARLAPDLTTRTRARLEKIRALLPAAERLASAVRTAESAGLLATVQKIVKAESVEESVSNEQELDDAVTKCLEALRKLHGTALVQGEEIMESDNFLLPLYPMGSFDGEESAIEISCKEKDKDQTMSSFLMAYQSLYDDIGVLSDQLRHSHNRLSGARQFENEEDGELLLEAALCVESLRNASAERRYLTTRAVRLKENIVVGVRAWLLMDLEKAAASLEGDLGLVRMSAALLRDASGTWQESVTQPSFPGESKPVLTTIEETIVQVESVMAEMNLAIEALWEPTTLAGAVEAARRADSLKKKAEELLQSCATGKAALTGLPRRLSPGLTEALKGMAEKSYLKVCRMNGVLKKATQEVLYGCSQLLGSFEDLDGSGGQCLKRTVFKQMLDAAQEAARTGDACVRNTTNLRKELSQLTTPEAAIEEAQKAKDLMQDQSKRMAVAVWDKLRLAQYEILEEDMKHSVQEAVAACFRTSHLTKSEAQKYERALQRFERADEAAQEAETLMEATKAVTDMRSCSIDIKSIIYRHKAKTS